jgi:hydrogenase nickel incorporation protein HypB
MCGPESNHTHTHDSNEVHVHQNILSHNDIHADENRKLFHENKTLCVNIISSPGSGKTTLLEKTAAILKDKYKLAFLIGDLETDRDAQRIRKQGVPAFQLTTAGACHLEAPLISVGLKILESQMKDHPQILFIENVGNLVCPSAYDLGEEIRVVLVSSPEGDDKPAKYPTVFRSSHIFLITKTDVSEHFDFSQEKIKQEALMLNPYLEVLELSSKTGAGLDKWIEFIENSYKKLAG